MTTTADSRAATTTDATNGLGPDATDEEHATDAKRWWTLAVLCLSLLIVFVGNASLNVAIPTLSRDLHATTSQLQWVVAAYSLVFAGLLFSTGALGDRFGRKGALQLGLVGFLVAAALASESTQMWQLIACRAAMGASAALIMPSTLSILVNVFPPHERTKAIAIWAATTGAAGAIGPVASGLLLGHFWYGSVFLVNVPIIAVRADRGMVPRAPLTGSGAGQARPARRRAVDHRHLGARVRTHPGSRQGMGERLHARRLRGRRWSCSGCSSPGSCTSTSRCWTCASSRTPPSAPAPAA